MPPRPYTEETVLALEAEVQRKDKAHQDALHEELSSLFEEYRVPLPSRPYSEESVGAYKAEIAKQKRWEKELLVHADVSLPNRPYTERSVAKYQQDVVKAKTTARNKRIGMVVLSLLIVVKFKNSRI